MTNIDLKLKWQIVSENSATRGFRSIRISDECICDLFIGVNKEFQRSLILSLPDKFKVNFKGIQKKHISIYYYKDNNFIVFQLNENNFTDLFDDLIISLHNGIKHFKNAEDYSKYFIQTFYRWSEFFEDKNAVLLSEADIKGLIGELLILKILINEPNIPDINYILHSWKGPYDKGNDFELENKNLEVKTKSPAAIEVQISSEYQLEINLGKGLELFVVVLQSDYNSGFNIRELILEIKNIINELSGEMYIIWKALGQKNINSMNVNQYDRYRFNAITWTSYNCAEDNFPKLSKSNIPIEINNLQYNLKISLLEPFIINQSKF